MTASKYTKRGRVSERRRYNIDVPSALHDDMVRMFGKFSIRTSFFNKLLEGLRRQAEEEGADVIVSRVLSGHFKVIEGE